MRILHTGVLTCAVAIALVMGGAGGVNAALIGPDPYLAFDNTLPGAGTSISPFSGMSFSYFHLEDFEDGLFNTPGVTADNGGVTSVVFGPSIHDSVDADDGTIDGSGLLGDSYFFSGGSTGITFTFDETALGTLPSHVGIVWTDGAGTIDFEAFGPGGASLGTLSGTHAGAGFTGQTDEDRFYGIIDAGGISAIKISNTGGGIEVDHLQYGLKGGAAVPEPATLILWSLGAVALVGLGWRRRERAA